MDTRSVKPLCVRNKNIRTAICISLSATAFLLAACWSQKQTGVPTVVRQNPAATILPTPVQPASPGARRSATIPVSPVSPTSIPITPTPVPSSPTPSLTPISPSPTPTPLVPPFSHIFIIMLENKEYGTVIGPDKAMPNFNLWVSEYTLLTKYYAITHPSLPNYLALISGDTFGVNTDCNDCYQDAPTLPDQLEASGRTWKGYFEDMPDPCFVGDTNIYMQKHDPFMYFDGIRLDATRCKRSVVPLTQLNSDLAANVLPDFALIVPNMCNDAHDCGIDVADTWLDHWVPPLMNTQAYTDGGLIVLTWDEGQDVRTCCGFTTTGGHIATVLISPWVKSGFEDDTPYTTYSLLKTIEKAWDLPYLGHAADESNVLILKPWKR